MEGPSFGASGSKHQDAKVMTGFGSAGLLDVGGPVRRRSGKLNCSLPKGSPSLQAWHAESGDQRPPDSAPA